MTEREIRRRKRFHAKGQKKITWNSILLVAAEDSFRRVVVEAFAAFGCYEMEVSFPSLLLLICFLTQFRKCDCHEEKKEIRSRYWQYVSLNGTSPLLFQNINTIVKNDLREKRQSKQGIDSFAQSRKELISSRLQTIIPPFALTSESVKNEKCREDSKTFLTRLTQMDLWALKMHDSSGKLPSGLLNGNVNQFGDFDECVGIEEPEFDIRGKYCLAYFQIRPESRDSNSNEIVRAFELLQSHFLFRSKLTDPGHRVPRFSTLNWGLCIPGSCSHEDLEIYLKTIVDRYSNGTGFNVEIKVDSEMCQEKKSFTFFPSFLIVCCVFFFFLTASGVATLKDYYFPEEWDGSVSIGSLLHCFSLKRNVKALLDFSRSPDDIRPAHGIRMINAIMLLLCHKSMASFFVPYTNRTAMAEKLVAPWTIIARIASLYTDSFIMMSGLLTSYSFTKTLNKTGRLDLKKEFLNRLIRIVPPLAAIILLSTFIIPELGSGPQWNLVVSHHAEKCKKNWWKNLLFIHNYFGFENMCLTHTHHMGIDTQLFFLSPILIYALYKWPIYATGGLTCAAAVSTMARYQATMEKNLSVFIYPGISITRLFDTADYSYIIPFHRLTSYIIGIFFGFGLRQYGKTCRLKSSYLRIGWTITFTFLSYVLIVAYEMIRPGYVYSNREAAIYAALAPIAWSLLVGWIIFVSQIGSGGGLGRFTSSKYFLVWTRLSYSVYLTQFPVFFFNVGMQKHSQEYSIFLLVNILEYFCILVASVFLTLFFDLPFVNMKKLFIQR